MLLAYLPTRYLSGFEDIALLNVYKTVLPKLYRFWCLDNVGFVDMKNYECLFTGHFLRHITGVCSTGRNSLTSKISPLISESRVLFFRDDGRGAASIANA